MSEHKRSGEDFGPKKLNKLLGMNKVERRDILDYVQEGQAEKEFVLRGTTDEVGGTGLTAMTSCVPAALALMGQQL